MSITRTKIREILLAYFREQDFTQDQFTDKDRGKIDMMVNHVIEVLGLSSRYNNLKSKQRKHLKSLVGQEVALMKRKYLCRRITWGRYRPIS